jgi:4-hydroxybenzoate polyprenyltransferase
MITQTDTIDENVPLVVDLDGTLLRTDSLWESIFLLARQRWYALGLIPVWLLRGKAYFKWRLAELVDLPVASLPYNEPFLTFLKAEQARPRRLILATGANEKIAHAIAAHLGLFDHVLASDQTVNLSGSNKLARIQTVLAGRSFDYAGNDRIDLSVWHRARRAILVNPTKSALLHAPRLTQVEKVFSDRRRGVVSYLHALRLYQWPKNFLVFLPILTAHLVTEWPLLMQAVLAFLAWGLCASAVYVLNDLLDLTADREHPKKRTRPFAAGIIPLAHGIALIPLLLAGSFSLGLLLSHRFVVVLGLYFIITIAYSTVIKKVMFLDVVVIAGLYILRVLGGAVAIGITPTFWLLVFSMFLFLHIALVKRYADLVALQPHGRLGLDGRDYQVGDMPLLISLGSSAGYLAVLVLALYVNSSDVHVIYRYPKALWLLCPILLYWSSRMWVKSVRGEMHHDPLIYALQDRASWIVLACSILVVAIAL